MPHFSANKRENLLPARHVLAQTIVHLSVPFLKGGKVIGLHHLEVFQDVSGLVARAQRKALKFATHGTTASVPEAIFANTGTMFASNVGTTTALPIRKSDNYYLSIVYMYY